MNNRYLLDTCVLSEYIRKQPEQKVIQWLDLQLEANLFVSVLTIGEIKKGIVKIEQSQAEKSRKLNLWLQTVIERFDNRILSLNKEILFQWGIICGNSEQKGRKLAVIDSLIAATAIFNRLTLVTRNESDFANLNITIYNPWINR